MQKTHYVLLVAIDENTGHTVGLTKTRGPASLLKKINFPGGKVEEGESVFEAARREMREETGVRIAEEEWNVFSVWDDPHYKITALMCLTDKVLYTRAQEDEPLWHLDIAKHLDYSRNQPDQYAPGFHAVLQQALAHLAFIKEED